MSQPSYTTISTMINDDLATSRQLLALLEQESSAMQSRNFDLLAQLVEDKTLLLQQLRHSAETRSRWLSTMATSNEEQTWLQWLETLDQPALKTQWQQIKQTIEHCQAVNEMNGKVIHRGIRCHEQLLRLMRGNTTNVGLYNACGEQQSAAHSGLSALSSYQA